MNKQVEKHLETRQLNIARALSGDLAAYKELDPIDRLRVNNILERSMDIFDDEDTGVTKN